MRFVERIVDHFAHSQLCLYFLDSFGLVPSSNHSQKINISYMLNYVAFRSSICYIAEITERYRSIP